MTFSDYQKEAYTTALPSAKNVPYMALGLAGEAGEVANKVKKLIRDGDTVEKRVAITQEIGDVMWYCAGLLSAMGGSLDLAAIENLAKLRARQSAGTLSGSGDTR